MTQDPVPTSGGPTPAPEPAKPEPATPAATSASPTPAAPKPAATPSTTASSSPAGGGAEEDYIKGAYKAVEGSAPWKRGARWEVVITQGVILGIVGLIIWLAPGFGAKASLQLIAVLVLAMALLSVWRILRGRVAPERMAAVAFRAGVGVTVGVITVLGALIVEDRDVGTVAVAIVLGVGLVLYGLVAILSAFARREAGSGIPVLALIIAALTVVVGILLIVNGRNGIDSLQGTFALLGILLLLGGLGFVGYGWMLRSAQIPPGDEE